VAVAAAAVLAVWGISRVQPAAVRSEPVAMEHGLASPPALTIPDQTPPTMALADGSVASLRDGARVDVDVQTDDLVRLLQHNGVVRYEVAPNPARRFVVDAQGVEVRVIGTVFTVKVAAERVTVNVERGRVAVESSERMAELTAGDEISLDIEPEETLVILEEDAAAPTSPDGPRSRPRTKTSTEPSVDELLQRADTARASGQLADAAAALSELVHRHPKDPRTYSSYFQLAKVERSRGHHGAAASAFAACYKRAPKGSLSEDARAEAAVSWLDAGQKTRAGKAARDYLERYPQGAHADRMRRILAKLP
jgi:TolA-binding protein